MKTLSTYKRSLWRYIFVALWLCGTFTAWGQTQLHRGDVAILGVNTNNQLCGSNTGSDIISIVFLKDIETGTSFIMTDNGYGRISDGFWGSTEGTIRFTYEGLSIIPKGTVVRFQTQISPGDIVKSITPLFLEWNIEKLSDGNFATFNIGVNGDQIYILSSNGWDNGNNTHQATFSGEVYYGMTTSSWCTNSCAGTSFSQLHPDVDPCYSMSIPSGNDRKFNLYTGPTTQTTPPVWMQRITNPDNWTGYASCANYNDADNLNFIEIGDIQIEPEYFMCEGFPQSMSNLNELRDLLSEHDISLIHSDTGARLDLWLEETTLLLPLTSAIINAYGPQSGEYEVIIYPNDYGYNIPGNYTGTESPNDPICDYIYETITVLTIYSPNAGTLVDPGSICVGDSLTLEVIGGYPAETQNDGHGDPIVYNTSWTSSDPTVASIDENTGEITAHQTGTVTITYNVSNPPYGGQTVPNCTVAYTTLELTISEAPITSPIYYSP